MEGPQSAYESVFLACDKHTVQSVGFSDGSGHSVGYFFQGRVQFTLSSPQRAAYLGGEETVGSVGENGWNESNIGQLIVSQFKA